jgi:hypothetical protein
MTIFPEHFDQDLLLDQVTVAAFLFLLRPEDLKMSAKELRTRGESTSDSQLITFRMSKVA